MSQASATDSNTGSISDDEADPKDSRLLTTSHDVARITRLPATLSGSVSPPPSRQSRFYPPRCQSQETWPSRDLLIKKKKRKEEEEEDEDAQFMRSTAESYKDDTFVNINNPANQHQVHTQNPTARLQSTHQERGEGQRPSLAAVEAGTAQITDHLALFTSQHSEALEKCQQTHHTNDINQMQLLPIPQWTSLYLQNFHPNGHHFVIHQHDHPIAGTHYDLRLQFSESSSLSWAIMYGLPGNPNSKRLNRNATETRVHCLWNHLIETGSTRTGSMLIWDTGVYEILPYRKMAPKKRNQVDYDETDHPSCSDTEEDSEEENDKPGRYFQLERKYVSESEKLREAFQKRKIILRLHGTKLPPNYTVSLRLTSHEYGISKQKRAKVSQSQTKAPTKRRKAQRLPNPRMERERRAPSSTPPLSSSPTIATTTSSESGLWSANRSSVLRPPLEIMENNESPQLEANRKGDEKGGEKEEKEEEEDRTGGQNSASGSDEEDLDEKVRITNAYPGAINSIGSVHQRRWFLSFDRFNSGFEPVRDQRDGSKKWVRRRKKQQKRKKRKGEEERHPRPNYLDPGHIDGSNNDDDDDKKFLGFEPFYVRGPEFERSVITGRTGEEVLADEGVEGFLARKGWRAILE